MISYNSFTVLLCTGCQIIVNHNRVSVINQIRISTDKGNILTKKMYMGLTWGRAYTMRPVLRLSVMLLQLLKLLNKMRL